MHLRKARYDNVKKIKRYPKGGILMWTRKELKRKSKIRFKANYWKSVLVALILFIVLGGSGTGAAGTFTDFIGNNTEDTEDIEDIEDMEDVKDAANIVDVIHDSVDEEDIPIVIAAVILVIVVVVAIALIIIIPLQVFVFNPLEIGCKRFFAKNLKEDAQMREICYAFDNGYKNGVKTMFFRDLYTFLWMLLSIIPGIIKSYEYQMIPYILAENPEISRNEAFQLSKDMMYGNKWKSFVLDLSFLGWEILNICTFGILGIFYVNAYEDQTEAALYETIKNQQERGE